MLGSYTVVTHSDRQVNRRMNDVLICFLFKRLEILAAKGGHSEMSVNSIDKQVYLRNSFYFFDSAIWEQFYFRQHQIIMTTSNINQTAVGTIPLPNTFELITHLKLLDAIVSLKNGIYDQAEEHGMKGTQVWDHFCHEAAAKFLEWSENIEISKKTIPVPPLDILMIWHSFMLNTSDYTRFDKQSLRGRMAGRGIDWKDIVGCSSLCPMATFSNFH